MRRARAASAATAAGAAHSSRVAAGGTTRVSIQAATPSIITPNSCLIVSIQGPALGNSLPAEAPTTSSGAPIPRLMANSAAAPRAMLPLWPITASVATSGGATQVVTISAESAPMTATPPKLPAVWRLLASLRRVWMAAGIWMVNTPIIDNASTTNSPANSTMIQVC